jgi:hypothetical protein
VAASFVVVDQSPVTQVLGPNQVIDAERVEFVTRPSGIYAQRIVPLAAWESEGSAAWVEPLATAIENMIAGGLASYATWVQTVDPATGLLADSISFVVTYDPGDGRPVMSAEATVPVASLTVDTAFGGVINSYFGGGSAALDPQQEVRNVYDALVATAAL